MTRITTNCPYKSVDILLQQRLFSGHSFGSETPLEPGNAATHHVWVFVYQSYSCLEYVHIWTYKKTFMSALWQLLCLSCVSYPACLTTWKSFTSPFSWDRYKQFLTKFTLDLILLLQLRWTEEYCKGMIHPSCIVSGSQTGAMSFRFGYHWE